MGAEVTDEELAEALAAEIDAEGNDLRLARRWAAMSAQDRVLSEENLRRSIDKARASLRKPSDE